MRYFEGKLMSGIQFRFLIFLLVGIPLILVAIPLIILSLGKFEGLVLLDDFASWVVNGVWPK